MLFSRFRQHEVRLVFLGLASVVILGSHGQVFAQTTNAFDQASNGTYNGGFSSGQNGGAGFGAWTITAGGTGGAFIQTGGPSGKSFDLWNQSANNSSIAARPFSTPLSVGQSFGVQLRLNGLDSNLSTNLLALEDASGNILFAYWHWGNEPNGAVNGWYSDATTANGVATNFSYAYQQFQNFTFTLTSPTNYTFADAGTGASFSGVIANAAIAKAAFLRINGNFTPPNGQDFQFDQLQIITRNFSFQSLSPAANAYSAPTNSAISLNAVAGAVRLKTNTVTLTLDGGAVTPVVTGNSNQLAISYQPPAAFGYSTLHTVAATVTDVNNTVYSTNWSFWAQPPVIAAGGTWSALNNAPPFGVNMGVLLGDGTVLGMNGDGRCCRLTPDSSGSYRNGTWSTILSMNQDRMFFASAVLTNGNVLVAGGEYGAGRRHAELFDALNNTWIRIPDPIPGPAFSDAIGKILPNGNVLVAPVSQFGGNVIYNVAANNWQTAASSLNQNEVAWAKLANDNILTIDTGAQTSEHYVPALDQWIADGNVPVPVYGYGAELGAGLLLPNGNVFYIGGNTNTAIYTPGSTPASAGSWVAGPTMVFGANQLGAVDAPAAMMPDGNILCVIGPVGGFNSPCYFYEYNYIANAFTQVGAPGGGSTYGSAPFGTSMLCLPTGEVLFVGGQNTQSLYIYSPNGAPLPAGKPAIGTITENTDGSFHLTGTNLNGLSEGAAYGDDEQMDSNYPLIRLTNNTSHLVYYARAYNRSSTSVQTGNQLLSTEFSLPQNLPAGTYSLVAVANGNPSAPVTFSYASPPVPTGLTAASGSNGYVRLSWNPSAGATAYNLKRASTPAGYFSTLATVAGNSYTNSGLTNGLTYYYKVSAIGSTGPSSDSSSVSATPSGATILPGATPVNLSSYYNRAGIYTDGQAFGGGGFDGGGHSFSANLLGSAIAWNNLVFTFGPPNTLDVVSCAGQTISLPAGNFNTLQFLAAAVNGDQQNQTFTVTYTDNSTAVFTQSVADWTATSYYQNENRLNRTLYRTTSSGGLDYWIVGVSAFVLPLDQTKTVKNIILPNNGNVNVMSVLLANDSAGVSLAGYYNRDGMYTDGTTFSTGGVDGGGHALTGTLLGSTRTWNGTVFPLGPMNATNVISCVNQTIPLPAGKYSQLQMLGMAVNGNQSAQSFVVTYTDATTATFTQGISDWFTPQNYAGEAKAVPMGYRNSSDGSSSENQSLYLYGYSFPLNGAKTIQSIRLPNNANVTIDSIALVPNYRPVFLANPFTLANASAGQSYSGAMATNASDANPGDTLTFAKVSGPAWLSVASSGAVSGTPSNADAGTNTFMVSVTDPSGLSDTATMNVVVTGGSAPSGSGTTAVVFGNGNECKPSSLTDATLVSGLRASGFNTLVMFTMTVDASGNFTYNDGLPICSNGVYTGDANWGALLAQCKAAPSTLNRIELCIDGWGDPSFANIQNRILLDGTGTNTILYKNLQALKAGLGLDALCFDDEDTYDSASSIAFGNMAGAVGFKVTLCPYTRQDYWTAVKTGLGSTCDAVYLQCYDGGGGNNPATWNLAFDPTGNFKVMPLYWDSERDNTFKLKMQGWKATGVAGGGLWPSCSGCTPPADASELKAYGQLLRVILETNIYYWQGGTASYNAGGNWMGGAIPASASGAINDSGSNNVVQINGSDPAWNLNNLWAGDASSAKGSYTQNGSSVTVGTGGGWFRLGTYTGTAGYYTLNAGTLNCSNEVHVGETGTGALNVYGGTMNVSANGLFLVGDQSANGTVLQTNGNVNCQQLWIGQRGAGSYSLSGGILTTADWTIIGRQGGNGTLNVSGGALNDLSGSGSFVVSSDDGGSSVGTLNHSGGTINCATVEYWIGQGANAVGTNNISGSAAVSVNNWFVVGRSGGRGVLNITGGTLTKLGGGNFIVGDNSIGRLIQSAGSIIVNSEFWVGQGANTSQYDLSGGSISVSNWFAVGRQNGAGIMNLSGGSLTKSGTSATRITIGSLGGTGTLTQTGGAITNTVSETYIGEAGPGSWTMSNGIAQLGPVILAVNSGASGTLNLNGGVMTATEIKGGSGTTNILNANGGTLRAAAGATNLVFGLSQANVGPSGLTVDTAGQNVNLSQSLLNNGGGKFTKIGAGTLTLGGVNTYASSTAVGAGTLLVNGSLAAASVVTVSNGATLGGNGTIGGLVVVNPGGTLSPGSGIGGLTLGATPTLSGTTLMEIKRGATTNADKIVRSGGSLTYGGTLVVTNIGTTLQSGDTFDLFDATGFSGSFGTAVLPALPAGLTWVTSNLTVNGSIAVATITCTLTYTAGANGSISGQTPQAVNYGGSGTAVTAVPNTGYAFANWSDGLTANPRTDANVSSNINVTANFAFTGALPAPWSSNAAGTITAATGAVYSNGVFTVAGAGANISGKNDNFWFISQPATNDATLIARVVSQSSTGSAARAGVMMRESLATGARSVFLGLVPTNQAQWVRRATTGGNSSTTTVNGKPAPYWLKLARSTNTFTGYISTDGSNWAQLASVNVAAAANFYLGLAVCSGSGGSLNTAVFDSVSSTNIFVPSATSAPSTNPAVLGPISLAPDSVSFTVTGPTNSVWQLEESGDLQTWTPLQSIGVIDGSVNQSEADDARSKRFLRLHANP